MGASKIVNALIAAVLLTGATVAVAASPAYAYPPDQFFGFLPDTQPYDGRTAGTFTWGNRSVGVQGWVSDYTPSASSTTVKFTFYIGDFDKDLFWKEETRTINNATRSFNFAVEGPAGGITWASVELCYTGGDCTLEMIHLR
jgi:hypothetical protein